MKTNFLLGVVIWSILISLCLLAVLWLNEDKIETGELVEESNVLQSYTFEEKQADVFERWQAEQPNKLAQKEWDAYMGEEK